MGYLGKKAKVICDESKTVLNLILLVVKLELFNRAFGKTNTSN
jgi:hypothetical protein